jgi:hypothetical protein
MTWEKSSERDRPLGTDFKLQAGLINLRESVDEICKEISDVPVIQLTTPSSE